MGLLTGDVSSVFSSIMGAFFLDGTLHRATLTDDGMGGGSASWSDTPVKAQLDSTTQQQQAGEGYTDRDQRILVLAHGLTRPDPDDEITLNGVRWSIASVGRDPAGAYYDLRGRFSGHVEASGEAGMLDFSDPANSAHLIYFMEPA